jgi:hypothetical protein
VAYASPLPKALGFNQLMNRALATVSLLVLSALGLGYCNGMYGIGDSGYVLDAFLDKPISSAKLVVSQQGRITNFIHGGKNVVLSEKEVQTNSDGYFSIGIWFASTKGWPVEHIRSSIDLISGDYSLSHHKPGFRHHKGTSSTIFAVAERDRNLDRIISIPADFLRSVALFGPERKLQQWTKAYEYAQQFVETDRESEYLTSNYCKEILLLRAETGRLSYNDIFGFTYDQQLESLKTVDTVVDECTRKVGNNRET